MSGSSYQALSSADRERNEEGYTPSSADLAAMPPAFAKALAAKKKPKEGSAAEEKLESPAFEKKEDATNPHGEKSPNMNNPRPMKDGSDNSPMKDGSKNPPKKIYKGM